jgi:hypothetical protein
MLDAAFEMVTQQCKPAVKQALPRYLQGCQMVYFQTKNPNLGKIWKALEWRMLLYFMTIWKIFRSFGVFGSSKTGNPGYLDAFHHTYLCALFSHQLVEVNACGNSAFF